MDSNNNQIEEIKNKLDIVSLIEKYVKLRSAGKNYSGLCPFHTEKTPSFIVSPDLQRYKCFGCGESGDIFNFIQRIENLDFPEALERLAKEADVKLVQTKPNYKFKTLEEINYNATKYFYKELKKDSNAQKYLSDRGFSESSIKNFGVGYAPRYPNLKEFLFKTKKYSNKELIDSGLFTLKGNSIKEKFYNRIMFPIRSRRGNVIAFTARILPGNDWGPKYMNTPDTPIFHKRNNVFGQYESRQEIRKNDLAILCEGSTDVISAHQHGIKNIVAPLGTGVTKEQLQNLSLLSKNLLFFFDSDRAGFDALVRAFKIASELKLNPYATDAKPYKDVDEILQKEPLKMKELIAEKSEAFSFILTAFLTDKDINRLEDLSKVRNFIGLLLPSVVDITTKNHYIRKASLLTKIPMKEFINQKTSPISERGSSPGVPVKEKPNSLEKKFLKLLLIQENITKKELIPEEYIFSTELGKVYHLICSSEYKNKEELYSELKNNKDVESVFEDLIFDLADIPTNKQEIKEEMNIIKKRLHDTYLRRKQKEISVKIAIAEEKNNEKEVEKYMKEMSEVNKLLQE
jgi:DNA primase